MRFDDVVVGTTYMVSIPEKLPSPTFEAVTGEVEATVLGMPLGYQAFAAAADYGRGREVPGTVLAKQKPWVLIEFTKRTTRMLPPNIGIGIEVERWEEDEWFGVRKPIYAYDETTYVAKVKPTRLGSTLEQREMAKLENRYVIAGLSDLRQETQKPDFRTANAEEKKQWHQRWTDERARLRAEFREQIANEAEEFLKRGGE